MKKIVFSDHAEYKFKILKKHGFEVTKEIVLSAIDTLFVSFLKSLMKFCEL